MVLPSFTGDLCLRGVGEGERESAVCLRSAFGVVRPTPRGVYMAVSKFRYGKIRDTVPLSAV